MHSTLDWDASLLDVFDVDEFGHVFLVKTSFVGELLWISFKKRKNTLNSWHLNLSICLMGVTNQFIGAVWKTLEVYVTVLILWDKS